MWDLLCVTKNSPKVRCMPEPDQHWGAVRLGFYPPMGLVREGDSVRKAECIHLDPLTRGHPLIFPNGRGRLSLEKIGFNNTVLNLGH